MSYDDGDDDPLWDDYKDELDPPEDHEEQYDVCPRCGGELVRRNGKYGPFYGCVKFPSCRFTCGEGEFMG